MTSFRWGAATDIGRVRQNNQDAVLVEDGLFLVADGMGGHRGGEVASAIAVDQIKEHFTDLSTETLVEAVQEANRAVVQRADDEPELRGMGTTLTGMARVEVEGEDRLAIVNVGDSRLYLLKGDGLEQITEDHSLVATLERQGQLTKAEAAVHPHRNILTRALGIDQMVLVDSWEVLPLPGDRYVLCSDGLFNEVSEDEIARVLRDHDDPDVAAQTLIDMANDGGGRDNVTVLVVDVLGEDGEPLLVDPTTERVTKATHASERVLLTPEVQAGSPAATDGAVVAPVARSQFTWRVVGFLVVIFIVLGIGVFAIGTIASNTFYVGDDGGEVVIYRGRPGGVLWMQPSVEERTGIAVETVPEPFRSDIVDGKDEPSLEDARAYVANVRAEVDDEDLGGALGEDLTLPSPSGDDSPPSGGDGDGGDAEVVPNQ